MVFIGIQGVNSPEIIKKLYQLFHYNIQEMISPTSWKRFLYLEDVLGTVNTETLFEINKDVRFQQVIRMLMDLGWNGKIPLIFITHEQFPNTQYIPIQNGITTEIQEDEQENNNKKLKKKNKQENKEKNEKRNINTYITLQFTFKK